MAAIPGAQRRLRLVQSNHDAWIWFCSRCGTPYLSSATEADAPRVCPQCAFGVLLRAHSDAVPRPGDPFLIVDSSLSVQAVSQHAEPALGMHERDAVNRHITELLIPADTEASGAVGLAEAITSAAGSDVEPITVFVRPSGSFGVRLRARIAGCWPPRAALLVLD